MIIFLYIQFVHILIFYTKREKQKRRERREGKEGGKGRKISGKLGKINAQTLLIFLYFHNYVVLSNALVGCARENILANGL